MLTMPDDGSDDAHSDRRAPPMEISTTAAKKKARADTELVCFPFLALFFTPFCTHAQANEEKSRRRWERNYSSEDSVVEDESSFAVYYCSFCGAFALVIDVKLDTLPTRKTDGARVLDTKARFRFAFLLF